MSAIYWHYHCRQWKLPLGAALKGTGGGVDSLFIFQDSLLKLLLGDARLAHEEVRCGVKLQFRQVGDQSHRHIYLVQRHLSSSGRHAGREVPVRRHL